MPWVLHYRVHDAAEHRVFEAERDLLASHPDVARVVVHDQGPVSNVATIRTRGGEVEQHWGDGVARQLEVWFEDELFRTESCALLEIHKARQPKPPPISPTRFTEALGAVFREEGASVRDALRAQLERAGLGELLRPLPPELTDPELTDQPVPSVTTATSHEEIIARAISTPSGRSRLAAAMTTPLRRRFDYAALSRSIMPIQQLPPGAAATYWASGSVIPFPPSPPEITPEEIQRSMRSLGITPMMDQGNAGSATVSATPTFVTQVQNNYSSVTGYNVPEPPGMFQPLQTGTMGSYAEAGYNGVARVDGLSGMSPGIHIGCILEIGGSLYPGNNGRFPITHVFDPTSVMISNHTAMVDHHVGLTWAVWNPQAIPQANDRVDTFGDWRTATGASLNHFASTLGLVRLPYESDEALRNRLVIALSPYSATPTDWGHIVEEYNTPTMCPNESAPRRTGWNRLLEDDED